MTGLRTRNMLPGVHRVRARLAGSQIAEYWYAWRGGPRILAVKARSDAELATDQERFGFRALSLHRPEDATAQLRGQRLGNH